MHRTRRIPRVLADRDLRVEEEREFGGMYRHEIEVQERVDISPKHLSFIWRVISGSAERDDLGELQDSEHRTQH